MNDYIDLAQHRYLERVITLHIALQKETRIVSTANDNTRVSFQDEFYQSGLNIVPSLEPRFVLTIEDTYRLL